MNNREKIIKIIKSKKHIKSAEIVKILKISRQKASKHLNTLLAEGLISKTGSTRASVYTLSSGNKISTQLLQKVTMVKKLKDLKEDEVYSELELKLGLQKLAKNIQSIAFYAFGEMLNNAIDHSGAKTVEIAAELNQSEFQFSIRDTGIGIFANIQRKFHLENEFVALEHLLKGKQTTFPEQHSGQGIFFTSRIADFFKIRSHQIEMTKNNLKDDLSLKEQRNIQGTEVSFQIKKRSRKVLRNLFAEYANDEYEFDRTQVIVHITSDRELLARSQAKRLLVGLEQYQVIVLDFKKVKEIGQAFVDEIFRVFKSRHPLIQITWKNANPAVEFMIRRGLGKFLKEA